MKPKPIVGYRRVSTEQQGKSGLGLEAQDTALQQYAQQTGAPVLATYTEIETGKRNDRPELAKAMAHARRSGATLAVAVLDRLSRSSLLINEVLDKGVDFVDCQNPSDTPFITRIRAAVAQEEVDKISQRTRLALAAAKARGVLLGGANPRIRRNLTMAARRKGAAASGKAARERARAAYADLMPQVRAWHGAGLTQQAIADRLNRQGHTTRGGKPWVQGAVSRLLAGHIDAQMA